MSKKLKNKIFSYELSRKGEGCGRCTWVKIGRFYLSFYPEERTGWGFGNFQNKLIYFAYNIGEVRWYLQ